MKKFFQDLKKSVYSPEFYQELPQKPLSYSLKYFLKLALFLALAQTLLLSIVIFPLLGKFLKETGREVSANFPAELEIRIENGMVSTNVSEPYSYGMPAPLRDVEGLKEIKNLLVIDTQGEVSPKDLETRQTLALLSRDSLLYREERDKISVQSLEKIESLVLNKERVDLFLEKYTPYLAIVFVFGAFMIFILTFFSFLSFLIFNFIAAFLTMLVGNIKGVKLGYEKSYQAGLHLATLPMILFSFFYFRVPLLLWLIFFGTVSAFNLEKKLAGPTEENSGKENSAEPENKNLPQEDPERRD